MGTFQVSQQYLDLLPGGGSYTENASKNFHGGKKDVMQENVTNYKQITNILQYMKNKKLSYTLLIKYRFLG